MTVHVEIGTQPGRVAREPHRLPTRFPGPPDFHLDRLKESSDRPRIPPRSPQLLKDPAAIAAARDKAIANQNKYGGISSDQVRSGAVPRSPPPPSPSRDWGRDYSSRDEERRGGGHVDAFSSSARSAPPSGRPHHAAAPAAAAPSHHAHSSSQPNFANFDDDDDFEDTNAATAGGPKSFVPRIVMSAKNAGSNASVPSSPAPLAPPPGSAGHSRRNTASGTSGDIFADFAHSAALLRRRLSRRRISSGWRR